MNAIKFDFKLEVTAIKFDVKLEVRALVLSNFFSCMIVSADSGPKFESVTKETLVRGEGIDVRRASVS